MNIKDWIINWFEENTDLNKEEIEKNISENYFEKGWIDSFKFISFITDIEETFNIHFYNDEFQDRSFTTIEGIAKIIQRKQNGAK